MNWIDSVNFYNDYVTLAYVDTEKWVADRPLLTFGNRFIPVERYKDFIGGIGFLVNFKGEIKAKLYLNSERGLHGYLNLERRTGGGVFLPRVPLSRFEIEPYRTINGEELINPAVAGEVNPPKVRLMIVKDPKTLVEILATPFGLEPDVVEVFQALDPRSGEVANQAILLQGVDPGVGEVEETRIVELFERAIDQVYSIPEYAMASAEVNRFFGAESQVNVFYTASGIREQTDALQNPGTFFFDQEGALLPLNIVMVNPKMIQYYSVYDLYQNILYMVVHEATTAPDIGGSVEDMFRTVLVGEGYFVRLVVEGLGLRDDYLEYTANYSRYYYSNKKKSNLHPDIQNIVKCFGDNMLEVVGVPTGLPNCDFDSDEETKVWREMGGGLEDLQNEPRVVVMG